MYKRKFSFFVYHNHKGERCRGRDYVTIQYLFQEAGAYFIRGWYPSYRVNVSPRN